MNAELERHCVEAAIETDLPMEIPEKRDYQSASEADLDRALVDAIEAAEAADNEYLEHLLKCELGSVYATRE